MTHAVRNNIWAALTLGPPPGVLLQLSDAVLQLPHKLLHIAAVQQLSSIISKL